MAEEVNQQGGNKWTYRSEKELVTGEEGRSNPQIVVNGHPIGTMERGATPIGGASASHDVEKG